MTGVCDDDEEGWCCSRGPAPDMMRRGLFHRLGLGIRNQKSNGQTLSFLYRGARDS